MTPNNEVPNVDGKVLYVKADVQSRMNFNNYSELGGPHFDSVSGLALSIVGAASMRLNGCDSLSQLSNAQLSATYTTKNFWDLNFAGNILFPNNMRLITKVTFEYQPLYFWGMGYENGNNSDNKTMQKKYLANIDAELLFSIADNLRFGPIFHSLLKNLIHSLFLTPKRGR